MTSLTSFAVAMVSVLLVAMDIPTLVTSQNTNDEDPRITESRNNAVEVSIYQLSPEKFSGDISARFYEFIAIEANNYCAAHLQLCGIANVTTRRFESDRATPSDGYPQEESFNTIVKFSLLLPDGAERRSGAKTLYYVRKTQLQAITVASSDTFRERTGYSIIRVEEQSVDLPPNFQLNLILCVIGLLFVIACGALYMGLRKCYGNRPANVAADTSAEVGNGDEKEHLNQGGNSVV